MNVEQRMEIERKVLTHLIETMAKHEWKLWSVNDGEESHTAATVEEALGIIFSVDESSITFKNGNDYRRAIIVLGNDGWDCIADHAYPGPEDSFVQVMEKEVDPFCERIAEEIGHG